MLLPFHMMPFSPLYRGRVLHLKGQLTDEPGVRPYNPEARDADGRPAAPDFSGWGATSFYQMARPSNEEMDEMLKSETRTGLRRSSWLCRAGWSKQRSLTPEQAKMLQEQAKIRAAEVAGDLTGGVFHRQVLRQLLAGRAGDGAGQLRVGDRLFHQSDLGGRPRQSLGRRRPLQSRPRLRSLRPAGQGDPTVPGRRFIARRLRQCPPRPLVERSRSSRRFRGPISLRAMVQGHRPIAPN